MKKYKLPFAGYHIFSPGWKKRISICLKIITVTPVTGAFDLDCLKMVTMMGVCKIGTGVSVTFLHFPSDTLRLKMSQLSQDFDTSAFGRRFIFPILQSPDFQLSHCATGPSSLIWLVHYNSFYLSFVHCFHNCILHIFNWHLLSSLQISSCHTAVCP